MAAYRLLSSQARSLIARPPSHYRANSRYRLSWFQDRGTLPWASPLQERLSASILQRTVGLSAMRSAQPRRWRFIPPAARRTTLQAIPAGRAAGAGGTITSPRLAPLTV